MPDAGIPVVMASINVKAKTLSLILEAHAKSKGMNLAYRHVISDQQDHCITYAKLWESSEVLAEKLSRSFSRGNRVVLAYSTGLNFIIALYACLRTGLIAVPLPLPRSNGSEVHRFIHACRDCHASIILTSSEHQILLRQTLPPDMARLVHADDHLHEIERRNIEGWTDVLNSDDIAILQYTSGSTGAPKGVVLSAANLVANLEQIRIAFDHTPDSCGVIWLPHYHDMGLIGGILQPLYAGFPVTLFSPLMFLQRPLRWLETINRYKATTSGGPCFAYELCVDKALKKTNLQLDLSSWRVAFNGAEAVRSSTLRRFVQAFAKYGFDERSFVPCYGLAEATLLVTSVPCGQGDQVTETKSHAIALSENETSRQLVSSGVPAIGVSVEIHDPETNVLCEEGKIGEICVRSPAVSVGYWHELKDASTHPNESSWLRTGDLGLLRNGNLYVTGRIKDVIVIRGQNIFAEDIEEIMRSTIPELEREGCVAFGVEGAHGEELVLLQEVGIRTLRNFSRETASSLIKEAVLRACGVIPSTYLPVKVGALARTSSGKISRSATKKLYTDKLLPPLAREDSFHPIHHN